MRKITKRSAAILSATVVAVGAGAAAWAGGWLVTGTGSASAAGASITPLTATINLNGTAFPDRELKAIANLTNKNEFAVKLTKFTGISNVKATKGGGYNDTCLADLGTPGKNLLIPTLPAQAPVIDSGAQGQQVELDVKIGPDFPQSCADTLITATIAFEGTSTVK